MNRSRMIILTAAAMTFFSTATSANHSWGGYHWARTDATFALTVVNSTTPDWDPYVVAAFAAWSSPVGGALDKLDMVEEVGSTSSKDRRRCTAPSGKVRICNLEYGQNGWLGIAGISIDSNGHITKGYVKLNDTYFAWDYYNQDDWKQSVTCQELGHELGLDHQDEDFYNYPLFTCMDYQVPPYEWPNDHDFETLESTYGHLDSYDSYWKPSAGGGGGGDCKGRGCNGKSGGQGNADIGWGQSLGRRGHHETFIRIDPDGTRHLTHVLWVEDH